jgi:hypothetical protein
LLDQLAYTYNNDGSEVITGSFIQGKPYTSYVQDLNAQHQETSATYYLANGNVYENQTFTYNQNGTTSEVITGLTGITQENILIDHSGNNENTFTYYTNNTVAAYFYENGQTFTSNGEATSINIMNGTSADTFNINGAFGEVVVYGYLPGSETMNFDHNDFANIAAVEAHTSAYGANGTIIKLDANDYVILQGVTVAQFEAHTSDWHFI